MKLVLKNVFKIFVGKKVVDNISWQIYFTQLKELKKQEKGITLLTLMITIVILLIISGITISSISGKNQRRFT